MSRPFFSRPSGPSHSFVRVNGKIRAREVRLIGVDKKMLGVFSISEAMQMARSQSVDLVEIAATATPPVCRLVDYGKFRYEQAKQDKEAKKHQHADRVKEIQLSATISPNDFNVKVTHAIDFLCEDMKVKLALRFRGREMMHQEFGKQVVQKFIEAIAPFGHPDAPPRIIGRGLNVMTSPLPRNKRAKNPNATPGIAPALEDNSEPDEPDDEEPGDAAPEQAGPDQPINDGGGKASDAPSKRQDKSSTGEFVNNPFDQIDVKPAE